MERYYDNKKMEMKKFINILKDNKKETLVGSVETYI